jgi:hypothetical protein
LFLLLVSTLAFTVPLLAVEIGSGDEDTGRHFRAPV